MAKINIDRLSMAVMNELAAYEKVTEEAVTRAVTKTAKETAEEISNRARENFKGDKYWRSWKYKRDPNLRGKYKMSMVVYSEKHYRLTHLLENGHAKVNGGRVYGRPHIIDGEELARRNLVKNIEEEMRRDVN